jgi:RNA exonuclease 4
MVGIGASGRQSALARCGVVDFDGNVLYDEFVRPPGFVTDFRTKYSGIRKKDLRAGVAVTLQEVSSFFNPSDCSNLPTISQCQNSVANLLKGKILVGHALRNDLDVLMLKHSRTQIRDTATYRPYMRVTVTQINICTIY